MHVRPNGVRKTSYRFTYENMELKKVSNYKYLGFSIDQYCSPVPGSEVLASAGEPALGAVISKIKNNGDVGYQTFIRLYMNCVVPVLDYCSGIWGLDAKHQQNFQGIDSVQHRAQRFFLGIDKKSLIIGFEGDMPIINASHRCLIKGAHFYNMLLKLENEWLVKQIYNVSREHSDGWAGNLKDQL